MERKDTELWATVLKPENHHRPSLIENVTSIALADSQDDEEVKVTVKAFIDAKLQHELIDLLEKLVFHNIKFKENGTLQNLLILTAFKADPKRSIDYINRLDDIEAPELAKKAMNE